MDGDLQPKQVKISNFGNIQETGVTAFSSNYRQFSRKIKKGNKTEETNYWEPIKWQGMNNLAPDTKKLKFSLIVENPFFRTYRLVKIIDIEGQKREEEVLIFPSGQKESFADIQEMYNIECPVVADKSIRITIRLDLLEGSGIPGMNSLTVSELSYRIGSAGNLSDQRISKKAQKGGVHPEN